MNEITKPRHYTQGPIECLDAINPMLPGGVAGIWQRPRRGRCSRGGSGTIGPSDLKLLVAYESRTHYQPRFDFYGIARRSVPKIVGREMDRAITKALQSAK